MSFIFISSRTYVKVGVVIMFVASTHFDSTQSARVTPLRSLCIEQNAYVLGVGPICGV